MKQKVTTRRDQFIERIDGIRPAIQLFSYLSDVYFFMKDREGYFMAANAIQIKKLGLGREEDIIGKTDFDFFPKSMAEDYRKGDWQVMDSGQPLKKHVELVSNQDGSVAWHITNKVPVFDKQGLAIGIMGFMQDLDRSAESWAPYRELREAIEHINNHYSQPIEVPHLARIVGLSISQFERRFKGAFNTTPKRFLIRYRVTRACHELINTNHPITRISIDNGFYDHSHFSREFKSTIGMSPGEYRKHHSQ